MNNILIDWLSANYIELAGALLGLAYIIFSIKQNILTWPTGFLTSALYIVVFLQSKFYADMGLQFYYLFISIYGWYFWLKGDKNIQNNSNAQLMVTRLNPTLTFVLALVALLIFVIIAFILVNYTDSPVPYMDAFTTALSIVATWMLARKILEHWLIWIVVDTVSAGLYIYRELWPTTILFIIYGSLAIVGYRKWKNEIQLKQA